ncbi:MAG: chromosome partitioning protein ParA, partial [Prevotella sp.]|nr:chromosome partitioning protein ParA [Prevotella sp.]
MERLITNTEKRQQTTDTKVLIKDWLFMCVSHWKWFVLSVIIVMVCAFFYVKKIPNIYTRTISILIKTEDKGSNTESQLKELGLVPNSVNLKNEILSMQTTVVAKEIVSQLNLDVNYYRDGTFHDEVVYGLDRPITVTFSGLNDNETASLTATLLSDGSVILSDMKRGGKEYPKPVKMKLGKKVWTAMGEISVSPTPYYKKNMEDKIKVTRSTLSGAAMSVKGRISATLRDNNSSIIDISYVDYSIARAEDVLNTLVSIYNENWMKDRNQISTSTNAFIKDRLGIIEEELGSVEQDISNYKSEHLIPDVQQVGSMAMAQASSAQQESGNLSNQIYVIRYIRSYLTDGMH